MFIVVRKGRAEKKERDEVYNFMYEGAPKCTLTLGKKVMRTDRAMAETVAKQLRGMFPAREWVVMADGEFSYKAAA